MDARLKAILLAFLSVTLAGLICLLFRWPNLFKCKEDYTQNEPMLQEIHSLMSSLSGKAGQAASKINLRQAAKSYTLNKKDMYLCLNNERGDYFNKNMLMYVALHELGHVLCPSIGHTEEWYGIFMNLLDQAANEGIYDPTIPTVKDYQNRCSLPVKHEKVRLVE